MPRLVLFPLLLVSQKEFARLYSFPYAFLYGWWIPNPIYYGHWYHGLGIMRLICMVVDMGPRENRAPRKNTVQFWDQHLKMIEFAISMRPNFEISNKSIIRKTSKWGVPKLMFGSWAWWPRARARSGQWLGRRCRCRRMQSMQMLVLLLLLLHLISPLFYSGSSNCSRRSSSIRSICFIAFDFISFHVCFLLVAFWL